MAVSMAPPGNLRGVWVSSAESPPRLPDEAHYAAFTASRRKTLAQGQDFFKRKVGFQGAVRAGIPGNTAGRRVGIPPARLRGRRTRALNIASTKCRLHSPPGIWLASGFRP